MFLFMMNIRTKTTRNDWCDLIKILWSIRIQPKTFHYLHNSLKKILITVVGFSNLRREGKKKTLQKTTVSSIVPRVWIIFDDMRLETCSSRCFLASCLPTFAIANFSGGNSSSSCTALLYLIAKFSISCHRQIQLNESSSKPYLV